MNVPSGIKNYLMYGLPFFILVIYLKGYYDMFMPQGLAVFVKWLFMAACFLVSSLWKYGPAKQSRTTSKKDLLSTFGERIPRFFTVL